MHSACGDFEMTVPVVRIKYSNDQPRDENGQWSDGGGGSASSPEMYHGTHSAAARAILDQGFTVGGSGMYGKGIYLTTELLAAQVHGSSVLKVTLKPDVKIKAFTEREIDALMGSPEVAEFARASNVDVEAAVSTMLTRQGYGAHSVQRVRTKYFIVHEPSSVESAVLKGEQVFYLTTVPKQKSAVIVYLGEEP